MSKIKARVGISNNNNLNTKFQNKRQQVMPKIVNSNEHTDIFRQHKN